MLPNWLLGKSKSKLQEILGGGGGGTDYTAGDGIDISNGVISFDPATTPTIDPSKIDGLDDDLAALAPKTAISNPNILINPWFTVNQRGFTTASSASGTYVADRWKVVSASGITITNGDGGITIDNTNGATYVTMETLLAPNVSKSLLGRKVTMSLSKVIGSTHLYKTFTMPESLPQASSVIDTVTTEDCTLRTVITGNGYVKIDVQVKEGKNVTIRAIKLEIGDVSTLARDARPDMAIELAKCKRYFQRFTFSTGAPIGIGFTQWSEGIRFILPYTEMRSSTPQLVVTSSANKIGYTNAGASAAVAISALSIAFVSKGLITLQAIVSNLTPGTVYAMINMDSDTMYIDFNAEL